jgi:hypothetical protein
MLKKEKYKNEIINKFSIKDKIIFSEIGFIDKFQEGDKTNMVFKIKTTNLPKKNKNSGAKAENASKKDDIIPKLNAVWGNDSYTDSDLKKYELCIILEILMRYLNDVSKQTLSELIPDRSANIVYFFGPESAKINDVWNK